MSLTTFSLTKEQISSKNKEETIGSEFLWSVFISALDSYRHDTILRPFPPNFLDEDGEKDVGKLRNVAKGVMDLKKLDDSPERIELVNWVLSPKNFELKICDQNKFEEIVEKTGQLTKSPKPNYILEVIYDRTMENKYNAIKGNQETFFAYHGSRIENFHSILHNGLNGNFNKNSFFGFGTYLSTELSLCMFYSPSCRAYFFGDHVSCVAVCEVISHPSVKYETKKCNRSKINSLFHSTDSVPENYYVIENDDLVRIKYLLVFCDKRQRVRVEPVQNWFSSHRFELLMIVYALVLVCVGLFNSKPVKHFVHKYFS